MPTPLTKEMVREKLGTLLSTDFRVPPEKLKDEATFRGTFGLDSLDVVDFIFLVQKTFGFTAKVETFAELHTFGAVVEHVYAKAAEASVNSAGT